MEPRDRTFGEVVASRRSGSAFTGEVVSRDLVRELVAEAHLAPSAFNGQPWRFVVAQGHDVARFDEALGERNAAKAHAAGTLVALLADTEVLEGKEGFYDGSPVRTTGEWAARNVALAAMSLLLSAESHGVASRPMIGFDPEGFREAADAPDTWVPVLCVLLGWPEADAEVSPRDRRPVDEVLRFL